MNALHSSSLTGHLAPVALALGLAFAAGPLLAQSPVTTYEYDANGNRSKVTAPLNRITLMSYDALNRLTQTTDPAGSIVRYGYDALDRLVTVTDPRNLVTSYGYNGLGDLLTQTSPDTGVTQHTYDAAGNLLTKTDAKGQTTTYQYDAVNRVTRIQHADGYEVRYTYDGAPGALGRLTLLEELQGATPIGQIQYAYDALGRLTGETRSAGGQSATTEYRYANGRLTGLTYPSGRRLDYTLDGLGRVAQIQLTDNGQVKTLVSAVQYHPVGGILSFTNGAGHQYHGLTAEASEVLKELVG